MEGGGWGGWGGVEYRARQVDGVPPHCPPHYHWRRPSAGERWQGHPRRQYPTYTHSSTFCYAWHCTLSSYQSTELLVTSLLLMGWQCHCKSSCLDECLYSITPLYVLTHKSMLHVLRITMSWLVPFQHNHLVYVYT